MVRLLSARLFEKKDFYFWPLLVGSFLVLSLYRATAHAPVWFDEIFFKAAIFGMPFWLYAYLSKKPLHFFGMETARFWHGAFNGLAIGGLLSFTAMILFSIQKDHVLIPGLFGSTLFWTEFGFAFATAFWESLFFYGLVLPVFSQKSKDEVNALAYTTLVFVVFHIPNLLLKVGLVGSLQPLLLLTLFAFGQGIIFLRTKSIATVVVSHAFWGMALLVYGR